MRTLHSLINKATIYLTIVSFMTLMCGGVSFAESNGNGERLSEDSSKAMSPGWLNADLYKTYRIKEVKKGDGGLQAGKEAEYLEKELGQSLAEDITNKAKVDLKKKTGAETGTPEGASLINAGAQDITYTPEGTLIHTETTEPNGQGKIIYQTYELDGKETRHYIIGKDPIYAYNSIAAGLNAWGGSGRNGYGDVIFIRSGEYTMPTTTLSYRHDLKIIGENARDTILIAQYSQTNSLRILNSSDILIQNLTFAGGPTGGFGVRISTNEYAQSPTTNITIDNCIMKGLEEGVMTDYGSSTSSENITISNCTMEGNRRGILAYTKNGLTIINNVVTGSEWSGIALIGTAGSNIYGNYSYDNGWNNYSTNVKDSDNYEFSPEKNKSSAATVGDITEAYRKEYDAHTIALPGYTKPIDTASLVAIFNMILSAKEGGSGQAQLDPALIAQLVQEALKESGLKVPEGELTPQQMEIAMMLASILNNPTDEQKVMIDALVSLINEAQKLEEETGSEELKQAKNDFAQIVATILLAQALPDLLKEGDISSIRGMFGDLNNENSRILLEYQEQVGEYYDNVVKELAANIVTLQIKDILSKELTERELENLPTQHIDEIINKIRNVKDKTITEEQILKVEAKYREEYLVPAKRILEENIKTLLQGFTQRLFGVLDGAGLVKEKTVEGKPVLNIDLSMR